MRTTRFLIGALASISLVTATVAIAADTSSAAAASVSVNLRGPDRTFVGKVTFTNSREHTGQTTVDIRIDRAPTVATALDAYHGIHIHANDNPVNGSGCIADPASPSSTWFVSADGHWMDMTLPPGHQHVGDLPSVLINGDGTASLRFATARFNLNQLIGKAVVLHAGPDNFQNVPLGMGAEQYTANSPTAIEKTEKTGNAGDRIACGVITG